MLIKKQIRTLKFLLTVQSLLFTGAGAGVGAGETRSRSKTDRLRNTAEVQARQFNLVLLSCVFRIRIRIQRLLDPDPYSEFRFGSRFLYLKNIFFLTTKEHL